MDNNTYFLDKNRLDDPQFVYRVTDNGYSGKHCDEFFYIVKKYYACLFYICTLLFFLWKQNNQKKYS